MKKSFRLFGFLLKSARTTVIFMVGAGVMAGLFSAAILAFVSHAVHRAGRVSTLLILGFVALALGKIITNAAAQLLLVRFSQTTILELSLSLCSKVVRAPLRAIERRGAASVLAVLTDDVASVTWAVQALPQLAMNAAVVSGCSAYLAYLSPRLFGCMVVVTILGAAAYRLLHTRAFARIYAARDARARLFDQFRGLTTGIKELMMHRGRRDAFILDEITPAASDFRAHNMAATTHYALAEAWIQTLYHSLIAMVIFVFPIASHPTQETLTGYVFAMLYMMSPLWSIISAFPVVSRGQVALTKIEELGVSLESDVAQLPAAEVPSALNAEQDVAPIRLSGIEFHYDTGDAGATTDRPFALGPLDFTLAPGELVFVVGGNGSGKSTFVKVLTGLYAPHHGTVAVGDAAVTDATREWYRDHFSVVFADCFLFSSLLGLTGADVDADARRYLELLQIDHKVSVRMGAHGREFSTIDLSTGQRKRLALVTAYLEDRPFYVFDEWAADQDPEYKHIFYSKLLPDLRARGKAVVVITHDDRYFHMGDRVVKLEDGRIVTWEPAPDLASEGRSVVIAGG